MKAHALPAAVLLALSPAAFGVIDRDSDQVSDLWELIHGATTLAATADTDGDGYNTLAESLFGTDPLNAASRPDSWATASAAYRTFHWPTLPDKRYDVLYTSDPLGAWTTGPSFIGTGAPLSWSPPTATAVQLFRVQVADIDTDGDNVADWEEKVAGFNHLRRYTEGLGSTSTSNPVTDYQRIRDLLNGTTHSISVGVADDRLVENWPDPGTVVFRRTGRLDPVTVNYSLGGTATPGVDYVAPAPLSVTFGLGVDQVAVDFAPLNDAASEPDETITVTLLPAQGLTLLSPSSTTLTIEDSSNGLVSPEAAARFLSQATFGPTPTEITRVRQLGFSAWIDDQFNRTPRLHLPEMLTWNAELYAASGETDPTSNRTNSDHRLEVWWRRALADDAASDPLRQRLAFAWSQFFVISDRMEALAADPRAMSGYYDLFVSGCDGSFRSLLEAVSRSPWMGIYLSHLRNQKANPSQNRFPDENYAREVLQLLSIGIWVLNPDGTRKLSNGADLDPDGLPVPASQPIPSYGETQIFALARVFTGLSYGTRWLNSNSLAQTPTTRFSDSRNIGWLPMRMFDEYHDIAAKTLWFPGHTTLNLPSRSPSATGAAGDADLAAALDYIVAHPNVGPFVARHLIQRLVTSNPSPAYVGRVAATFANDGTGTRGNLRAVVRAVLLDDEARNPAWLAVETHGAVREPYTRYVAAARALQAAPRDVIARRYDTSVTITSGGRYRGFGSLDGDFQQRPQSAPSVFNFYLPDYQPPGVLRDNHLFAPEMQITNSVTSILGPNRYSTGINVTGVSSSSLSPTRWNPSSYSDVSGTVGIDETLWNTSLDETPWIPLAEGDPDLLVAALDRLLCYGRMSPDTHRSITRSVRRMDDPLATADTTLRLRRAVARLRVALHLVTISPDFAVIR